MLKRSGIVITVLALCLCVTVCGAAWADVTLNADTFGANFLSVLLYEIHKIDGMSDKKEGDTLTDEEIAKVTRISVPDSKLAFTELELKGIEKFTSLTYLDARSITSTALDVSALTKLETLLVSGKNITSLTILTTTSGAISLKNLTASHCTSLTSLNLSEVEGGNGGANTTYSIENLDLSSCTKLQNLDISGCPALETLNVSGCTQLGSITKGLSEFPHLKSVNADGTNLKSFGLSENDASIKSLSFKNCPSLESIGVSGAAKNSLETLNVSGSTKFTTCNPTTLEGTEFNISGLTALTKLDITGTGITVLDVSDVP